MNKDAFLIISVILSVSYVFLDHAPIIVISIESRGKKTTKCFTCYYWSKIKLSTFYMGRNYINCC